ncbi:MAG: TlpA family protein disulfide reductase [Muribaculaceae bacterium]|nr:TlpA family protein disulfide reductase [Muribaculaceae bacterium]
MKKIALLFCLFALMASSNIYAQLPAVTVKTIDGQTVKIDTLNNGGKPFILDMFATWCKPCLRELDAIAEVYDEWQEETGVKIFAVSIDQAQNVHKVKPLVSNHAWDYEVFIDANEDLKQALGVQMIPFTMIVDGQGKIVYKHTGYNNGDENELIEKVRELINQ